MTIHVHDFRDFTFDRHRTVDDRPFGGGEGMVLKPEPLSRALESLGIQAKTEPRATRGSRGSGDAEEEAARTCVILLSAQGRPFSQQVARESGQV